MTAELHYFPFYAKDWLSSGARFAMTPAQRGAYIDLLALAWGNGNAEPCLDPSPEILAGLSGLGRDWKRLSPLILAQFEERDGLLYNAKLSEVWHDSQERHGKAVENGRKGGKAPGKRRGRKPKNTVAIPVLLETPPKTAIPKYQSEPTETLVEPTALTSSLSPMALGVETPRPAELPGDRGRVTTGTADKLSAIIARVAAGFKPVEAT